MFDNVEKQKKVLLDEFRDFDVNVEERSLSDVEEVRKDVLTSDLEKITRSKLEIEIKGFLAKRGRQ